MIYTRPLPLVAALSGAILSCASLALAAQTTVPPSIKAYYSTETAVMLKKDTAGWARLARQSSTPDYVAIGRPNKAGQAKTTTRAEEIQHMGELFAHVTSITKFGHHIDSLTIHKGNAVAIVSSTIEMTTKAGPPDGKSHRIFFQGKSEDAWVKMGGTWKIKSSKTISQGGMVDGKKVPGG